MLAPASKASWVLSTCSATVMGTAGLSVFCGTLPVIATQMMQGFCVASDIEEHRFLFTLHGDVEPISPLCDGPRHQGGAAMRGHAGDHRVMGPVVLREVHPRDAMVQQPAHCHDQGQEREHSPAGSRRA